MAGFAQADYSGNAFSLGLGGIVADSISSPDDAKAFTTSLATMLMRI